MIRYLKEKEVSDMIGRSVKTLRNDRFMRKGLPYVKNGRSVRYKVEDVVTYMEDRKVQPMEG